MLVTVTQRRVVVGGKADRGIGSWTVVTADRSRAGVAGVAGVGFPLGAARTGILLR
jgi:hypothetical protein